jgi:hypothetical protein
MSRSGSGIGFACGCFVLCGPSFGSVAGASVQMYADATKIWEGGTAYYGGVSCLSCPPIQYAAAGATSPTTIYLKANAAIDVYGDNLIGQCTGMSFFG